MNEKEALSYLNVKTIEELPVTIEFEVFQVKNFIFSTVFHPKLALSKIQKLKQLIHIHEKVLNSSKGHGLVEVNHNEFCIQSQFPLDAVQKFNKHKAQIFMDLHQAHDMKQMVSCIEVLIQLFLEYASKWPAFSGIDIKLTKEIDSMLFLKELKGLNEKGVNTFHEMIIKEHVLSHEMKHESSRLSAISKDFKMSHPEFILA